MTGIITFGVYCAYQKWYINPQYSNGNEPEPEVRLNLALYTAVMIPISTFLFGMLCSPSQMPFPQTNVELVPVGWVSRESVHWIVPIIAASLYLPGYVSTSQRVLYSADIPPGFVGSSYCSSPSSCILQRATTRKFVATSYFFVHGTHTNFFCARENQLSREYSCWKFADQELPGWCVSVSH